MGAGCGARTWWGRIVAENQLYYGDNRHVLERYIRDESVDLVYIDPPFNSNQNYNVLYREQSGARSSAQIKAFTDTWKWNQAAAFAYHDVVVAGGKTSEAMQAFMTLLGRSDMMAYLAMMAPRLVELHRVLKPTGSLYLHCDPTASHYLKILMDAIFGPQNFRNEIVWKRTSSHNDAKRWAQIQDTILFYAGDRFTWNPIHLEHDPKYVAEFYRYTDERGRYRLDHIIRSASMGPRPNLAYEYKGYTPEWGWRTTRDKLEALDADGRLEWSKTGRPYLKRYLHEQKGTTAPALWDDILPVQAQAAERLGYPTQKPLALLERIIQASSNPGDVVLDAFCGCGTAIAAAHKLGRHWIGIDITKLAIDVIKDRLRAAAGEDAIPKVAGDPVTPEEAAELARTDPYGFQFWALRELSVERLEEKRGADRGIDGKITFLEPGQRKGSNVIVSVKAGNTGPAHVRELRGTMTRENADIGVLVTMHEPTRAMRAEAASAGYYQSWLKEHPRVQLITATELLAGKRIDYPVRYQGVEVERNPLLRDHDVPLPGMGYGTAAG